jgi:hypothetical protein
MYTLILNFGVNKLRSSRANIDLKTLLGVLSHHWMALACVDVWLDVTLPSIEVFSTVMVFFNSSATPGKPLLASASKTPIL